ncbi:MAG TPA: response regulator [Bacteroidales bacterium]|nr:MAG: hypothetical protein A2X11_00485 [Bacteroidetes bacterium GWE2_42_24]OFY27555.1 MAG: hypothetical protein A2X09_07740 [Bacteroidetes bacterium GWF2_43_11]HAQ64964.1 response regulator [Bacteroidales bacterium]HBZ66079.1 response regulator [Bacteroidales bacterium]
MRQMYRWPGKTIIIAEDAETSVQYFSAALSHSELNILWAGNGFEAVDLFKKNSQTDLILMDLDMPGMDGLDATRAIRLLSKTIPIIAQTAHVMLADSLAGSEAGCNDFITKPISLAVLFSTIDQYLSEDGKGG